MDGSSAFYVLANLVGEDSVVILTALVKYITIFSLKDENSNISSRKPIT